MDRDGLIACSMAFVDFCQRYRVTGRETWSDDTTVTVTVEGLHLRGFEGFWPFLAMRLMSEEIIKYYTNVRLVRKEWSLDLLVENRFCFRLVRQGGPSLREWQKVPFHVSPVLIIGGASGVGKTTVIDGLKCMLGNSIYTLPQHTTRYRRVGEKDGEYYIFSSLSRDAIESNPRFSAVTEVRGSFYWIDLVNELNTVFDRSAAVYCYTMSLEDKVQLARQKWPRMMYVWLEASEESIRERLQGRLDVDIAKSLDYNRVLNAKSLSDYIVINSDGQLANTITTVARLMQEQIGVGAG